MDTIPKTALAEEDHVVEEKWQGMVPRSSEIVLAHDPVGIRPQRDPLRAQFIAGLEVSTSAVWEDGGGACEEIVRVCPRVEGFHAAEDIVVLDARDGRYSGLCPRILVNLL